MDQTLRWTESAKKAWHNAKLEGRSAHCHFVYVLQDPRSSEIRYVGQCAQPSKRLKSHCDCEQQGNLDLQAWINELSLKSLLPHMILVETCAAWEINDREKWWIHELQSSKRLLNITLVSAVSGKYFKSSDKRWIARPKPLSEAASQISSGIRRDISHRYASGESIAFISESLRLSEDVVREIWAFEKESDRANQAGPE